MLLGNYNIFNANPGRAVGGPTDPVNKFKAGSVGLFYHANEAAADVAPFSKSLAEINKSAFFNGYNPPYTWRLPMTPGGIGSNTIRCVAEIAAANLAGGVNGTAAITAAATLAASMQLVVSAVATITAAASMTANMNAIAPLTAAITGGASLTVTLQALANAVAAITAGGSLAVTPYAIGHMSADILPYTELSPEALAASVWNAVAASFNSAGTMGEKMNLAGSGGVDYDALKAAVWEAVLSDYDTDPASAAKIIKAIKALAAAGL